MNALADIISNRCFICEDDESIPCSSAPSIPNLDIQFSDAETVVVDELLEDLGLASIEVPKHMIPHQFAAEYDLRGYASLDVFEDLRVQAVYFPFMPMNYIHWLDYAIPLSRFFFVDQSWLSWGHARRWNQEDEKKYEEWEAEKERLSTDTEPLDARGKSYDPPSPFKRPSRVPRGLLSIPSVEDVKRRRTIYYTRPPLTRANRIEWSSISSLSCASERSRSTREGSDKAGSFRRSLRISAAAKLQHIQAHLRRALHAAD